MTKEISIRHIISNRERGKKTSLEKNYYERFHLTKMLKFPEVFEYVL